MSQEKFDRVTGYIRSSKDEGATIRGGDRVGDRGYVVAPTVLTGTHEDMKDVQEAIFGPGRRGGAVPLECPLDRLAARCGAGAAHVVIALRLGMRSRLGGRRGFS